jgi:hypothetical protein
MGKKVIAVFDFTGCCHLVRLDIFVLWLCMALSAHRTGHIVGNLTLLGAIGTPDKLLVSITMQVNAMHWPMEAVQTWLLRNKLVY